MEIPLPGDEGRDASVGHRGSCVVVFESGHLRWMEVLKIGGDLNVNGKFPGFSEIKDWDVAAKSVKLMINDIVHLMLSKGLKIFESNPLYHGKPM